MGIVSDYVSFLSIRKSVSAIGLVPEIGYMDAFGLKELMRHFISKWDYYTDQGAAFSLLIRKHRTEFARFGIYADELLDIGAYSNTPTDLYLIAGGFDKTYCVRSDVHRNIHVTICGGTLSMFVSESDVEITAKGYSKVSFTGKSLSGVRYRGLDSSSVDLRLFGNVSCRCMLFNSAGGKVLTGDHVLLSYVCNDSSVLDSVISEHSICKAVYMDSARGSMKILGQALAQCLNSGSNVVELRTYKGAVACYGGPVNVIDGDDTVN